MKIGLIDVDSSRFPNLVLMKLSAYHKSIGDDTSWYDPLLGGRYDRVYMSKVFSFTQDYEYYVNADEIVRGGTGYCIDVVDGKETYTNRHQTELPQDIEHIMPDYSLYGINGTAYGYLTRGCPRQCDFCIVKHKEGTVSHKVADLNEFWSGQKNIVLLDPNILACKDSIELLNQLEQSNAKVDFNQGLDIRFVNDEIADVISNIKINKIHFAYDRISDKDMIEPKFLSFRKKSNIHPHSLQVYVLCGYESRELTEDDLYRVKWLKDNGYAPYVMLYQKESLQKGCDLRRFQRYVNNRFIFWSTTWEDYNV